MLELNKVYCMDCIDFLEKLDDESVDLFLLDPPYFMGDKEFKNKKKNYERVVEDWDNQWRSMYEYLDWCEIWLEISYEKLKPGGTILITGTFHNAFDIHIMLKYMGGYIDGEWVEPLWTFRNFIPWFKPNAMPIFMAKQMGVYAYSCEYINYFSKGPVAYFNYDGLKAYNDDKQHRDIFIINNRPHSESVGHPTQKPMKLWHLLVNAHCPHLGLVVDFFAGSGTTAIAAYKNDVNYILNDVNSEYVEMANKRIEEYSETHKIGE